MSKLFVSYARNDFTAVNQIMLELHILGIGYWMDMRNLHGGDEWLKEITKAITKHEKFLLFMSSASMESSSVYQEIQIAIRMNKKIIILRLEDVEFSPALKEQLSKIQWMDYWSPDWKPRLVMALVSSPGQESPISKISLSRLPKTGRQFFGRHNELEFLSRAWRDGIDCLVSICAFGGVGKSALVNHWLAELSRIGFPTARRVFGWSFYSQGIDRRQTSADYFLHTALAFFGDADPLQGGTWEKGERLAQLIRKERSLIVLDGVEPLQYRPGPFGGRIKDPGLATVVRELAFNMNGICLITSRLEIEDLAEFSEPSIYRLDLTNLDLEAGYELLKARGVKGPKDEIKAAVQEFNGHALSLNLLASFLIDIERGDITRRGRVPKLLDAGDPLGSHANRVMKAYDELLQGAEREILRVVALFDRPAHFNILKKLREEPEIPQLTDKISKLSEIEWRRAIARLRKSELLLPPSSEDDDAVDAHPIIREYFSEALMRESPVAWREGNYRIYEYLKNLPGKLPETAEEMEPLFQAVIHGSEANLHQEVFKDVFWPQIRRGKEHFSVNKLGAWGSDLAVLEVFFAEPWSKPHPMLSPHDQAIVLAAAGVSLRALGRLADAKEPIRTRLDMHRVEQNWDQASFDAGNLAAVQITMGELVEAELVIREMLYFADLSQDPKREIVAHGRLGRALHRLGKLDKALDAFRQAEQIQIDINPQQQTLQSIHGTWYADVFLDLGKPEIAYTRASKTMEAAINSGSQLDIGITHVILGRSILDLQQKDGLEIAKQHFDNAVRSLRGADRRDHLPYGLLARSKLFMLREDWKSAQRDLNEVRELSRRANMRLHEADTWLLLGEMAIRLNNINEAKIAIGQAQELISRCSYGLRIKSLQQLNQYLSG